MLSDIPIDSPPIPALVVATGTHATSPPGLRRSLGICQIVQNFAGADDIFRELTLFFPDSAANYFNVYEKHTRFGGPARTTLLRGPKHGQLRDHGAGEFTFRPNLGYYGQEKVVALVELGVYRVLVTYLIQVVKDQNVGDDSESVRKYCGTKGRMWKISSLNFPVQIDRVP